LKYGQGTFEVSPSRRVRRNVLIRRRADSSRIRFWSTLRASTMKTLTIVRHLLLCATVLALAACSLLQPRDPLQVHVAGIEPLEGQGLEMRMLVKLRVQNPNDAPITYNGVALEMDVQGKTFASGVSAESGNVPGFGESVIAVPMTVSTMNMVRQALGMMKGASAGTGPGKIAYELKGKLSSSGMSATRFSTKGDLELPTAAQTATD
jgi:LEA14-like dessication related protein